MTSGAGIFQTIPLGQEAIMMKTPRTVTWKVVHEVLAKNVLLQKNVPHQR